jgi:AmmeMemoRadiSam system protein B
MSHGAWQMPWGDVPVDEELAARLQTACQLLREDASAHSREHAIEVQLPFLHRFRPDVRIVPVALGRLSLEECRELGENVADAIAGDADPPLLVASSDMSHYVPDAVARKKDRMAIDRMLALDPDGLYGTVRTERISMCGVLPATVVLFAACRLGATSARLIRYATSGDVSRDFDQVVGYAGLAFR